MFDSRIPRHFLSYGASDQKTVRELVGLYHGILVPATVASFQREGTAGFVLTLSAKADGPPYVIDPRFPLFQQELHSQKASHVALSEILEDPQLLAEGDPLPSDFTPERINRIASAWVEFNLSYRTQQSAKFAKYAERLGDELDESDSQGPQRLIAPYFAVYGTSDSWWARSVEFYEATRNAADGRIPVTRVLAAKNPAALLELVREPGTDDVCIWVSGLEELNAPYNDLVSYARAIQIISDSDRKSFALYGGFFAVALSAVGLGGCSHGIGYGEHRNWLELPRSGPPPTRYYLPTVHRYARQEEAQQLWLHDNRLVAPGSISPPIGLDYHELMLHSVRARADEIGGYGSLNLPDTIVQLESEMEEFQDRLHSGSPNRLLVRTGKRLSSHLAVWLEALRSL